MVITIVSRSTSKTAKYWRVLVVIQFAQEARCSHPPCDSFGEIGVTKCASNQSGTLFFF